MSEFAPRAQDSDINSYFSLSHSVFEVLLLNLVYLGRQSDNQSLKQVKENKTK